MSYVGLNTNRFRIISIYLDLLNDFSVKTKVSGQPNNGRKQEVIEFIDSITDANTPQPQFQLLSSIIQRGFRNKNMNPDTFLNKLKFELKQQAVDTDSVVPKIQTLARMLDTENSEVFARINGE